MNSKTLLRNTRKPYFYKNAENISVITVTVAFVCMMIISIIPIHLTNTVRGYEHTLIALENDRLAIEKQYAIMLSSINTEEEGSVVENGSHIIVQKQTISSTLSASTR